MKLGEWGKRLHHKGFQHFLTNASKMIYVCPLKKAQFKMQALNTTITQLAHLIALQSCLFENICAQARPLRFPSPT